MSKRTTRRKRKYLDPESPEVLEAILDRIRNMTREELIYWMNYKPENATETFRTAKNE